MRTIFFLTLLSTAAAAQAQDSTSEHCVLKPGFTVAQAREGICNFDLATQRFAGSPAAQAQCLLRAVRRGAHIGDANAPTRLTNRADTVVGVTRQQLSGYLADTGVSAVDVGLTTSPITATYFVIHDTSSPNCSAVLKPTGSCPTRGAMPTLLNDPRWPTNVSFGGHKPLGRAKPIAHGWTNRVGASIVEVPYTAHISHLKFDYCHDASQKRGIFLGVENIQPRIGHPAIPRPGKKVNDLVAPTPGFTDPQYDRLALMYVVTSVMRGRWLIPAYHAVIDTQYKQGHDDPQNFDVAKFDAAVARLADRLERGA